jgi:hypothetical protein
VWQPDVREEDRFKIEQLIGDLVPSDKDEAAGHRRNAAREHARFKAGKDVRVRYGDDDTRHVREHERWTTTDEFGELLEKGGEIAQAVETHIYEHWINAADKRLRLEMIGEKVKGNLQAELQIGAEQDQDTTEQAAPAGVPPGQAMPRIAAGTGTPAAAVGA